MRCFLRREFGPRSFEEYLDRLLKARETRVHKHRRWRALCKEEKTNFKSIFNEDRYRLTAKHKATFDEIRDLKQDKDNLARMMQAEDARVEQVLCRPEGFILSGLPEQEGVLLQLEREFMGFEFEDERRKGERDGLLADLEECFGSGLRVRSSAKKRSLFDLVVVLKSEFREMVRRKLGKFEVQGTGREVDLDFLGPGDLDNVAEFVGKLRVDDNVYALPSQFHANLKSIEKIAQVYRDNFKCNALMAAGETHPGLTLVLEIDDKQDIAVTINQIEEQLEKVIRIKERFYQELLVAIDREEEQKSELLSKELRKKNQLNLQTQVEDSDIKFIFSSLFEEHKPPLEDSSMFESKWASCVTQELKNSRELGQLPLPTQRMILTKFRVIFENYKSNLLVEFKNLNEQEQFITRYCDDFLKKVNSFILIDDDRGEIVYHFQKDYNLFLTNWQDLIFKEKAKAEYHKR